MPALYLMTLNYTYLAIGGNLGKVESESIRQQKVDMFVKVDEARAAEVNWG